MGLEECKASEFTHRRCLTYSDAKSYTIINNDEAGVCGHNYYLCADWWVR